MALIKCNKCEKIISDSAPKCVGCGASMKKESRKTKILIVILVILISSLLMILITKNKYIKEKSNGLKSKIEKPNKKEQISIETDTFFYFNKINPIKEIIKGVAFDVNSNRLGGFSVNGEREGFWRLFYKGNNLALEGDYKNGLMNGYFKHYFENGNLFHEGAYIDGSMQEVNEWSGIPQSGRMGLHVFYFRNGIISDKVNYKNGQLHGTHERWYSNGVKRLSAEYRNGLLFGPYQSWDKTGICVVNGRYDKFENFKAE